MRKNKEMEIMKKYGPQKEEEGSSFMVNEPEAVYGVSISMDRSAYLSEDILEDVAIFAQKDRDDGRMIPHDQVFEILKGRFGWK